MIKNSKLSYDYTPILTKEDNNKYNCPVSNLVSTDHYRIDIDQDPCNAVVYLNIGYDNLTEFDSPIYLSATDAMELANKLLEYSITAIQNESNALSSRVFVSELERRIKNKEVDWLSVYPIKLADQDEFPGCMILDIHYYLNTDLNTKYSSRVLSCNFFTNRDKYLSTALEDRLKEKYNISTVKLYEDKFSKLFYAVKISYDLSDDQLAKIRSKALEELSSMTKL